jgi:DNA polymerase-4
LVFLDPTPSNLMKKIIHVDMDCFYAQVEMRDNPALKNVPLAIGGLPKTRSVLCTSNYIARKFGVKSAMPTDFALRLCPGLVVIPPNFHKYQEASEQIQEIFYEYTEKVEPLSLDEAYLDVGLEANASKLAMEIKNKIKQKTDLTCSVGVAPCKFLAKVASDWKKPDGYFVIRPNEVDDFVKDLDLKFIPGVGIKTLEHLKSLNIKNCGDLRNIPLPILSTQFGKFSQSLHEYAFGIDDRDVVSDYERKSLSVESTFLQDFFWSHELKLEFEIILKELNHRLGEFLLDDPTRKVKKIFTKVRFKDISRTSTETIIQASTSKNGFNCYEFESLFLELLMSNLSKKNMPVRLIGLGVRFLNHEESKFDFQLPLFNHF